VLRVDVPSAMVHGDVAQGYGPVADAFRRNVAQRREIGAAGKAHVTVRQLLSHQAG
jgi:hypothetical protein